MDVIVPHDRQEMIAMMAARKTSGQQNVFRSRIVPREGACDSRLVGPRVGNPGACSGVSGWPDCRQEAWEAVGGDLQPYLTRSMKACAPCGARTLPSWMM
jgi:hypothetical protein